MSEKQPRVIALCLVRQGERVLVQEFLPSDRPTPYYRPIGGGVEYGEASLEAARREVQEELGVVVRDLQLLTIVENIYEIEGRVGHQIAFVYEGHFEDESLYERAWLPGMEANGQPFRAVWKELASFDQARCPLYPVGLLALLRE